MSLNQSHAPNGQGVVLFYGERLLIFYDGCDLKLSSNTSSHVRGTHSGRTYLTSHRVIFTNKKNADNILSFSMPFVHMKGVDIKQPVFGANRIEGRVIAEPNGGWQGEANFSLTFKRGGAIEFGQALMELGKRATQTQHEFKPPPYAAVMSPSGAAEYYACPPPAYAPPYQDPYYSFVQPHEAFGAPPPQSLYHVGTPPPYPGAAPQMTNWGPPPAGYGTTSMPPNQAPYPTQYGQHNNGETYQSAAHAAKAAEAAASSSSVAGGYYFVDNPHAVFAQPSAPPNTEPPPYPDDAGGTSSFGDQAPPRYEQQHPQNGPPNIQSKKDQ